MRRFSLAVALTLVVAACGSADGADTSTTTQAVTTTPITAGTTTVVPSSEPATTLPVAPPEPAGASGVGDPYFPELGNGGYDVTHYDIDITVDVETATLDATTTVTAVATETLATFNLDLIGLDVASVTVDGVPAAYLREGPELRISPDGGIVSGEEFSVSISYSGKPQRVIMQSVGEPIGWIQTPEGIYVGAEPDAAHSWFPSNDHPSDKATYGFSITVPKPYTGAANGRLISVTDNGDTQTFRWELDELMATYLATIVVGEYDRVESDGPDGVLLRDYLPITFNGTIPDAFSVTAEAMELYNEWFGPYPFDVYGHIVVYDFLGALETQTLSLMGNRALYDEVVVHELSHQWWGDSVTPATWQDIWLNEGFATFSEFLWTEHRQGTAAMFEQIADLHENLSSIGHYAISDPKESQLFGPAVYWRGGMTLHALRVALDDDDLLKQIFQTYFIRYEDGIVTTQDFIDVVEELSGRDFTELWDAWLYSSALPDLPTG
jgi:aminopeptidase N